MSSTFDNELAAWQRDWRGQPLPSISAEELARSVQRGNRHALIGTLGAALITIVALAPLIRRAFDGTIDGQFLTGIVAFAWNTTVSARPSSSFTVPESLPRNWIGGVVVFGSVSPGSGSTLSSSLTSTVNGPPDMFVRNTGISSSSFCVTNRGNVVSTTSGSR